jgi:hypothetical protein
MSLHTELRDMRSKVCALKAQIASIKKQKRELALLKRRAEKLALELERERSTNEQ